MKQGIRLIARPGTFMNQLQWSPNHWYIVTFFLMLATVETYTGSHQAFYEGYAMVFSQKFGFGFDTALGAVITIKLGLMLAGALGLAYLLWFMGALFGRNSSRRVLIRRVASALTFLLAGYICWNLSDSANLYIFASILFYVWGVILGYCVIREQFTLNTMEAIVIAFFALFVVTSTWHYSSVVFDSLLQSQISEIAHKQGNTTVPKVY